MKAWTAIGVVVAVGAVVVAANAPAAMQAGQEFGAVSDTAAPDLAKLDYLLGEWNVRSFVRNDSGEFVESPTTSSFRVRYLYDGLSILAEFYGKRRDGFYGVHVITHDPERGLIHSYFNARANRRIEFEGTFRGDEYDLTRLGGYGGGDFLYRETDSEITSDSFVKRIYQSDDDGNTWVEGDYYFRFERVRR